MSGPAIPSVGELKKILDGRGIDHANAIEKQDLLDLVLSSGGLPASGGSGSSSRQGMQGGHGSSSRSDHGGSSSGTASRRSRGQAGFLRMARAAEVLGVTPDASDAAIHEAHKVLMLQWHPDKNPDKVDEATRRFKEVRAAHDLLITVPHDMRIAAVRVAKKKHRTSLEQRRAAEHLAEEQWAEQQQAAAERAASRRKTRTTEQSSPANLQEVQQQLQQAQQQVQQLQWQLRQQQQQQQQQQQLQLQLQVQQQLQRQLQTQVQQILRAPDQHAASQAQSPPKRQPTRHAARSNTTQFQDILAAAARERDEGGASTEAPQPMDMAGDRASGRALDLRGGHTGVVGGCIECFTTCTECYICVTDTCYHCSKCVCEAGHLSDNDLQSWTAPRRGGGEQQRWRGGGGMRAAPSAGRAAAPAPHAVPEVVEGIALGEKKATLQTL